MNGSVDGLRAVKVKNLMKILNWSHEVIGWCESLDFDQFKFNKCLGELFIVENIQKKWYYTNFLPERYPNIFLY